MRGVDAAYVAGLVDGDGTFDLAIHLRTSTHKGKVYHAMGCSPVLKVALKNHENDREVMEWLQGLAGHSIIKEGNKVYVWQVRGVQLLPFIEALTPFLHVKRKHAAITMEALRLIAEKGGKSWTREYAQKLAALQDRMFETRFHNRGQLIKWDGKAILAKFDELHPV